MHLSKFYTIFSEKTLISVIISLFRLKEKKLFELRLQKATRQSFKAHSFKHLKRKIAQLLTIETNRKN